MAETPSAIHAIQAVGLVTSSALAGASIVISTIMVPRLLEAPTPLMLRQWNGVFTHGKNAMPPLAALAASSYFYLAYKSHQLLGPAASKWKLYLVAGLLSIGIVPYTLVGMSPTNQKLLNKVEETKGLSVKDELVEAGLGEETAHKLIDKWGLLNLGRGVLLLASGFVGAWTALQ
ncbi:hypothetical protein BP6252_09846 [Coleophoma cylindrospora]|uniref:DUF1772-domain-containing protein n=1 Tax=Coleophoma cylindrospora TaxID=1849047 RepID=A0A3D8QWZ0_9HELO|nr:hypothetical protein BP6252_09846 [Coleophoma cylindrospora]